MNSAPPLFPRKPAFERALAALAHPACLAALGLMLLNDAVLRRWWPSWWTGKLSDLAWLVIAPLALAVLLSWFAPARRAKWALWLSLLLCGLSFILVKTIPAANLLATRLAADLLQQPPALALDPTDLLALPGLLIAAWAWRTGSPSPALRVGRTLPGSLNWRSVRGLVVLPLAALLLLADASAPDLGIVCLVQDNNAIVAGAEFTSYTSTDGGLTWTSRPGGAGCRRQSDGNGAPVDVPGPKQGEVYRFKQTEYIQLSTDGGQTFKEIYRVSWPSQRAEFYYLKTHPGNAHMITGPFSALADPASGNMLFAMGHEGVLVRKPDGAWVWSMGGEYQRLPETGLPSAAVFNVLLGGVMVMAVVLALVIYASLALRWTFHWLRLVVLILAWLAWLSVDILFPPTTATSYTETVSWMGIAAAVVLALPLVIEQSIRLARRAPRAIPALVGLALLGGLLYFLPYVLWFYNALPNFDLASIAALVVSAVLLAVGLVIFLRKPARVG